MSFFEEMGMGEIRTKKNQRLTESIDKNGKRNFMTGLLCWFTIFVPGFLLIIVFHQIKKYLYKLLSRGSATVDKYKKTLERTLFAIIKRGEEWRNKHEESSKHANIEVGNFWQIRE